MTSSRAAHLLLRGDNRAALDDLLSRADRFALVYLDPPYNTGRMRGARKNFRDTAQHDWRGAIGEIATKAHALLSESGFLAVSINQKELFNLKQTLDDVFGERSFVGLFPVKIRHKDRQLMINATFHDLFEYLLIYRKTRTTRFFTESMTVRTDKFEYSVRTLSPPAQQLTLGGKRVEVFPKGLYEIKKTGHTEDSFRRYVIAGKLATANWSGEWYETHLRKLGDDLLVRVFGLENDGLGYRWFQTGNARRRSGVYFQSQHSAGRPLLPTNDLDFTEVVPTIFKEGGPGCDFKDSKKPEALLIFLMSICTKRGDLVLDPFAGSGTTLAAAVKTGRISVLVENNAASLAVIEQRAFNLREGRDLDGVRHSFELRQATCGKRSDVSG